MMLQQSRRQRRGAVLIEAALVYPVLFLLVFAILMLCLVVFRHHQVSHIAREAARYASVRGARYSSDTGQTAVTSTDVYNNAIKPQAVSMDLSALSYTVAWPNGNTQTTTVGGVTTANTVSVQVTYQFQTGLFGMITVKSTAVAPMSF